MEPLFGSVTEPSFPFHPETNTQRPGIPHAALLQNLEKGEAIPPCCPSLGKMELKLNDKTLGGQNPVP